MRYQDWDVLLYPKQSDVPFKEFKTVCYAAQDSNDGGAVGGDGTFDSRTSLHLNLRATDFVTRKS